MKGRNDRGQYESNTWPHRVGDGVDSRCFCCRARQHCNISSRLGVAVAPRWALSAAVQDPADTSTRSASDRLSMLLGRPLGNRARLDFGALAECELLAACVCIWLGRPDARRLVRRAAYQRHTDHGWPALDDPGSTSAAKRHMGYRHSMATHISPGEFHLASLMLLIPQPRLGARVVTQAAPCEHHTAKRPARTPPDRDTRDRERNDRCGSSAAAPDFWTAG